MILTQSLIVVPLKTELSDSTLLFEQSLPLINEPLLFALLVAVFGKASFLPPLPLQLLLLAQPLLVALTPELILTLLVDRLTLLAFGLSLLLKLSLLFELLLGLGLALTALIHPLLFLLSLLLLGLGLTLTSLVHPLLLLLLRFGLALTPFVHTLLLLLSLLLLSFGLALLSASLALLLLLLLLGVLLCPLLPFGFFLLLLLLLALLIIGLCARQSAGSNQQGNNDNSQVCHTVKEFVVHISSKIANALLRLFQHFHSADVKGKEHAIGHHGENTTIWRLAERLRYTHFVRG